jgi:hypothetical protein
MDWSSIEPIDEQPDESPPDAREQPEFVLSGAWLPDVRGDEAACAGRFAVATTKALASKKRFRAVILSLCVVVILLA